MGEQVDARFNGLIAQLGERTPDKREVKWFESILSPLPEKGNATSDWLIEINTEHK